METSACAKCGSTRIIPDAHTTETSSGGSLAVCVNAKPEAILFKGRHTEYLKACICADCGHVELYVENADKLYEAYSKSQQGVGV
jgi:hypothetical protein